MIISPQFYIQIVFLILLFALVLTLIKYSQEGDINTLTSGNTSFKEIKSRYPTRSDVVQRLHALILYKEGYIRWNRLIVISMIASLIILNFTREQIHFGEFILLSSFLFLCIEIPHRWGNAHISSGVIQEATRLFTYYDSLTQ